MIPSNHTDPGSDHPPDDKIKAYLKKHSSGGGGNHLEDKMRDYIRKHEHHKNPDTPPPKPPPKPPIDIGKHPVHIGVSDELCVDISSPACAAVKDMCALMKYADPAVDPSLCAGVSHFCDMAHDKAPHLKSALSSKLCTQFTASAPACDIAMETCSSDPQLNKSAFCQRIGTLCAPAVYK